jgi:hypothetical protein
MKKVAGMITTYAYPTKSSHEEVPRSAVTQSEEISK